MVAMDHDALLRRHLVELLDGGSAHLKFGEAAGGWPEHLRGRKPEAAAHTPWQVLEHLRICQWDILEFSRSASHQSPDWPGGYWPDSEAPPSSDAWQESIDRIEAELAAMRALIEDEGSDLYQPLPWGQGQTLLREAMLLADHNAYHLGELMTLRKQLEAHDLARA